MLKYTINCMMALKKKDGFRQLSNTSKIINSEDTANKKNIPGNILSSDSIL